MDVNVLLDKVYDWGREESLSRSLALAGSASLATLAAGWRMFRRKPDERARVSVDVPKGQSVRVDVSSDDKRN